MKAWQVAALVIGVVVLGFGFLLSKGWTPDAGIQSQHAVERAFENEWISAGEKLANDAAVLWMRFDNSSAYCTFEDVDDFLLRAEFYATNNIRVMFDYESVNLGTNEYSVLGLGGCGGSKPEVSTTYRIKNLRAADPAEEPTAEQLAELAKKYQ